jgi:hypothetical protein
MLGALWEWANGLVVVAATVGEAEMDGPTLVALLAGIGGTITGIGALVVQHRNARNVASQGYVDQNLAAMQAVIALHEKEAERLRNADAEKRQTILELRDELATVRQECETCMRRLTVLEGKGSA